MIPRTMVVVLAMGAWAAVGLAGEDSRPPPHFRTVVVCDSFPGGYQVAVADMNDDRRPDIVALGEQSGTVDWFENPGKDDRWARHPISGTQTRNNIDLAINDIDGDGRPDVAVASDFDLGKSDKGGTVSWFRRSGGQDPEWTAIRIHAEPTAHRIRWADIDGDGLKELITVPILGRGAKLPESAGEQVRLLCHSIPSNPIRDRWPVEVIDQGLTVVHGLLAIDWDGDGRDELVTASNEGIHLFRREADEATMRWSRRQLGTGHAGASPNRGSSEVAVGCRLNAGRFLAAVEPWHGNRVAVYSPPDGREPGGLWLRAVIDDSLQVGHALCCADLDGDGQDEIVAGYRGDGRSLYGYRRSASRLSHWARFVIDAGGIAAQGVVAADLNGDGHTDLVATGGSTHNVKLYVNERGAKSRPAG
ncbi:MAG TPA: FG-GAP-like repeat-containing protein [Phycisphaerae bacterium]|nr:FG-GAP-like repeat-containing protein [Phycisphaerae bacterium]HRY68588.1 FG-GAP-like repeat-containing protein [Phycisphaerae bacterium]HSA25637.1 FG-GAP-like repeat-containing protein [Phycisphaerae bacterium]